MILSSQLSQRIFLASSLASALALSGCSMAPSAPVTTQLTAMQGKVHGGQQPVGGASIQLYKASTNGYASASTALIPIPVLSSPDGSFSLTGTYPTYTCQPGDYLYVVATGGNPGVSGTHNNSALALMAGLGPCSGVTSSTFISINELTTVASVWALAPFMSSATAIGTSATNVQGLGQAFAAINKIVNVSNGTMPGPALPAGATLPIAEINTLADLLATCINTVDTTSPAAQSSACQTLASETFNSGAQNTIATALNLAQNPNGSSAIYSMVSGAGAPFQPTLSGPVPAWTIAINYVGGGLNTPKAIAVDQTGNVWVANSGNNSVTKFDNTGAAISGASGFTAGAMNAPAAIAIDLNGTPWVANHGGNTVTHLSADGLSGTAFGGGGLSAPGSIAIDAVGDVWVANFGNSSVTQLSYTGSPISTTGYTAGGVNQPVAIAIDPK